MKTLGKELNKTCYSLAPKHSVFVASFLSAFFDKLFRYNIRSRLFSRYSVFSSLKFIPLTAIFSQ